MADKLSFLQAVTQRRTYYDLRAESPIPDSRIEELCKTAITYLPSSFNAQSTRMVLLLNDHHKKLWDITLEVLFSMIPTEQQEATGKKVKGFRDAYGTVSLSTMIGK